MTDAYERAYRELFEPDIRHRDGIPWYEAPVPRRLHRCTWQSSGWVGFHQIVRCACGAYYDASRKRWFDRNQRNTKAKLRWRR